jgi:hypothetical protein
MSKVKIHSDDEKYLMKRLGQISSSFCVVHIIGRRVSGNQDPNVPRSLFEIADDRRTKPQAGVAFY